MPVHCALREWYYYRKGIHGYPKCKTKALEALSRVKTCQSTTEEVDRNILSVFEEMKEFHPDLSEDDFNNTTADLEAIMSNENGEQSGAATSEIQVILSESQDISTLAETPSEHGLSLRLLEDLDRSAHSQDVTSWEWIHNTYPDGQKSRFMFYLRVAIILSFIGMAPSLTTFSVRAVGFTQVGIKAGSIAAAMMSVDAKTSCNGRSVQGGLIATLQSIGASGLGILGSLISMTVGAVAVLVAVKCQRRCK